MVMRYLKEPDDAPTKIVEVIGDMPPSLAWCCTPCRIKESQAGHPRSGKADRG
jgi:hypothetical protein